MSIPTIGIKTFFECYSEIRVRIIDVALSANLNDCVVHENDGKTQIFQRFEFLSYFTLLYFAGNRNPYNLKNTEKLSSHCKGNVWENTNIPKLWVSYIFYVWH